MTVGLLFSVLMAAPAGQALPTGWGLYASGLDVDSEELGREVRALVLTGSEGTYSLDPDCRGSATATMEHRARVGSGTHEYRHEVHRIEFVGASGGQRLFWVLVDTYPERLPPGPPETADPGFLVSGFFERM